ncbi:DUF1800 domain-containing protein [Thermogemmatispora tikiterensis]|uniref:DUF1800 domain-containing protein n=1 Tax=Thermogemmatispora tikiterensis TaxID=1825093 RepID=A0A328VJ92_9CHLR|nr:DUF1800 domain-containing protein [Thermogemmatispora tikiterensis]RAQ95733.1 hypothetical protein A4R35_09320 [Thermogemmatispora tikiterensis]
MEEAASYEEPHWPPSAEQSEPQPTTSAANAAPASARLPRRRLLGLAGIGLGAAGLVVGGVTLEQFWQHSHSTGAQADQQLIGHLLRRAGFGAGPEELALYRNLGFSAAVDRLLNYQQVPDDEMEQRLAALKLNLDRPQDQQRWWLLRMAWTQRPLLEKMTLFWHGVLTSSFRKVGGPRFYRRMIIQNQFLREHAFDTFDSILLGITRDPAMLFYLDLTKSTRNIPNENYARELMELFTIGLGHYTQQDVTEGAAALSGWHVRGFSSYYNPATHSDRIKHFLGHSGNLDYRDVIRILANHPAAPWFLARKLFSFFVYENPSEEDLQPLVTAYQQSNHNIGAVMRALLLSPQFASAKAYRSRLKSPVEFAVGAYRALGLQDDGSLLPQFTTLMGQTLFDPPNVGGWPGDKVSAFWLNSGTWMTRLNYVDLLLRRGLGRGVVHPLNLQSLIEKNRIASPEAFVDYFAAFLLDGQLAGDRRDQLVSYLTMPATGRQESVTFANGKSYPLSRVRGALYLLLASPEYQLN